MNKLLDRIRSMDRQQLETIFTSSAFLVTNGLLFVNLFLLAGELGFGVSFTVGDASA